jgi:hypothetical protein
MWAETGCGAKALLKFVLPSEVSLHKPISPEYKHKHRIYGEFRVRYVHSSCYFCFGRQRRAPNLLRLSS